SGTARLIAFELQVVAVRGFQLQCLTVPRAGLVVAGFLEKRLRDHESCMRPVARVLGSRTSSSTSLSCRSIAALSGTFKAAGGGAAGGTVPPAWRTAVPPFWGVVCVLAVSCATRAVSTGLGFALL